jgi:predicted nucleotidyltransferase
MLDPALDKLVRLLQSYKPERIILFGSRARGEADEYSDYDLIVIKKTSRSFLQRLEDMVPFLAAFDHPAEILVYTPEEFEQLSDVGFGWMIKQEGVTIYERSLS